MRNLIDYMAVYDTPALKGVHYSFQAKNLADAIEYCKAHFTVKVNTIIEVPSYDDKNSYIYHDVTSLVKKVTEADFTLVGNDSNGNPRYVTHFLMLNTDQDEKDCENDGLLQISNLYSLAVKRANKIGGRKYRGKDFGGGIVFKSSNLRMLVADVNGLLNR